MNVFQFAAHVTEQSRGQWFNGTVQVDGIGPVGIKAYNNWVQVMRWNGIQDGSPEFKSAKAFKAWIVDTLGSRA
jgi:hypothetical protein